MSSQPFSLSHRREFCERQRQQRCAQIVAPRVLTCAGSGSHRGVVAEVYALAQEIQHKHNVLKRESAETGKNVRLRRKFA